MNNLYIKTLTLHIITNSIVCLTCWVGGTQPLFNDFMIINVICIDLSFQTGFVGLLTISLTWESLRRTVFPANNVWGPTNQISLHMQKAKSTKTQKIVYQQMMELILWMPEVSLSLMVKLVYEKFSWSLPWPWYLDVKGFYDRNVYLNFITTIPYVLNLICSRQAFSRLPSILLIIFAFYYSHGQLRKF